TRQRSQPAVAANVKSARDSAMRALELDPGLSEGYTLLAESWVNPGALPNDVDEAIALSELSVRLNKNNFGAHRLLARLYTFKSRLNNGNLDPDFAGKAIKEWKEIARLDPRNAEAWAFLSELYGESKKPNERIEALKRWLASSSPLDRQFYQSVMRGQADLSPETAGKKLGPALLQAGRVGEAIEVLSQLVADDPEDEGSVDELREALGSADAKTAATAIETLRQAIYANPGNLSLVRLLAEIQAKAGNLPDAVKTIESAIAKLTPNDRASAAALQVSIGDIYSSADKLTEAAAAYEKALSVRGLDNAQTVAQDEREFALGVFDKLITIYKRANRISDAKNVIQRARKMLGNDDLFADRQLVSLYQETGDKAAALSTVQALRQKKPDDVSLLRLEATLLSENGMVDKGVELIQKRISTPNQPKSTTPRLDDDFSNYLFISQLYDDAGRGGDAIAAAQKALSMANGADQQQIAKMMLATAQQTAGKYADAEATLHDVLKQTPGNPIALNNLGYFLLERGERYEEALDLIQRAVKTDPTNPSYLDSLGWAYFKLQKLDDAEKYLTQAAVLDYSSGTIQEHLGDVYEKKGKTQQARAAWKRAVQLLSKADDTARVNQKLAKLN
ncbi:MAG TPA: tetratricopeptide repeat protein, partial [Pyrinomonadaceae bacterium]|nr:tetratricopeptide repeat protein [Pyrinomonadaceae bacterium]